MYLEGARAEPRPAHPSTERTRPSRAGGRDLALAITIGAALSVGRTDPCALHQCCRCDQAESFSGGYLETTGDRATMLRDWPMAAVDPPLASSPFPRTRKYQATIASTSKTSPTISAPRRLPDR